jgi:hypothetical protein
MGEPARVDPGTTVLGDAESASSHAGFTQVPNSLARGPLPPDAKLLAIVLLSYAWGDDRAFPAQETLARDLSRSVDYVQRQLARLASFGIVTSVRRGRKSNAYVLNRDAANLRYQPDSKPQKRGIDKAAKARRQRRYGAAEQRHDKDSTFKTQQQQDAGANAPAVVAELRKALREIGVPENRAEQVAIRGAVDPDRACAWIAAAPSLRGKKDNVPAYVCSGISKGWEPPVTGRDATKDAAKAVIRAEDDRATAEQRAERDADALRQAAFADLPASVRDDLERRAELDMPACVRRAAPSPARIRAQAALIAEREGILAQTTAGNPENATPADPPLYGAKSPGGGLAEIDREMVAAFGRQ